MGERSEGDDIAGFVDKLGSNVTDFHPGDRIAAFHVMWTPGGSYAEYALSPAHTAFHIPNTTSFEEAAAIPFAAMTAAIGLYIRLGLYLSHLRRRSSSCHLLLVELHLLLARIPCN